jgi:hypothetical protein
MTSTNTPNPGKVAAIARTNVTRSTNVSKVGKRQGRRRHLHQVFPLANPSQMRGQRKKTMKGKSRHDEGKNIVDQRTPLYTFHSTQV